MGHPMLTFPQYALRIDFGALAGCAASTPLWLHRYPVHYVRDVPEGEPQRVWLFDEPIVIARRPGTSCTHRECVSLHAPCDVGEWFWGISFKI